MERNTRSGGFHATLLMFLACLCARVLLVFRFLEWIRPNLPVLQNTNPTSTLQRFASTLALIVHDCLCLSFFVSFATEDNECVDMIHKHFDRLESIPEYKNAHVFVYIESNMSYITADRYQQVIRDRGVGPGNFTIEFVNRDSSKLNRAGLRTDRVLKQAMVDELKRDLSNGCVHFARDFVSMDKDRILEQLAAQLRVFRKHIIHRSEESTADVSVRYSGKGSGMQDDLAFVLMMVIYYGHLMRMSERYMAMAEYKGWTH